MKLNSDYIRLTLSGTTYRRRTPRVGIILGIVWAVPFLVYVIGGW